MTMLRFTVGKLRAVGDERWATWPQGDHDRIAAGDMTALAYIHEAFGGPGSISELYPREDPEIGTHLAAIYRMARVLSLRDTS
jgi:hypothetical protein